MNEFDVLQNPFDNLEIAIVFDAYPDEVRKSLMFLRQLIFDTALVTEGVGEIEEALRWGQPSYLTTESKSGSIIRIAQVHSQEDQYAIYFHCQTNLISTFKQLYPVEFHYEGNRGILFYGGDEIPVKALGHCISLALAYHRNKSKRVRII